MLRGDVNFAFHNFYSKCSTFEAEIYALRDGLRLCTEKGSQNFDAKVDSLSAIICIQKWGKVNEE